MDQLLLIGVLAFLLWGYASSKISKSLGAAQQPAQPQAVAQTPAVSIVPAAPIKVTPINGPELTFPVTTAPRDISVVNLVHPGANPIAVAVAATPSPFPVDYSYGNPAFAPAAPWALTEAAYIDAVTSGNFFGGFGGEVSPENDGMCGSRADHKIPCK